MKRKIPLLAGNDSICGPVVTDQFRFLKYAIRRLIKDCLMVCWCRLRDRQTRRPVLASYLNIEPRTLPRFRAPHAQLSTPPVQ